MTAAVTWLLCGDRMQRAKSITKESKREAVCRNPGEMVALARITVQEVVTSIQVWDVFCRYRQ